MEDCIFCKIVRNEIPSKKVYEDPDAVAFLDINPANPGHCLVVSKRHYESITDVDDADLKKMIAIVKVMAKRIKTSLNADGINVLQNNGRHAGQIVNHIHFHVIPRFPNDNVIITYQKVNVPNLDEIQKKLSSTGASSGYEWGTRI
ncbi:MAG: HIT family protein [Candidatus Aenigmarchaeota archaeon]|nr:HIT family protein [Candidatus Aenigmarchaeota archaeon]